VLFASTVNHIRPQQHNPSYIHALDLRSAQARLSIEQKTIIIDGRWAGGGNNVRWLRVHVVVVHVTERRDENELCVLRLFNHNSTDAVDNLFELNERRWLAWRDASEHDVSAGGMYAVLSHTHTRTHTHTHTHTRTRTHLGVVRLSQLAFLYNGVLLIHKRPNEHNGVGLLATNYVQEVVQWAVHHVTLQRVCNMRTRISECVCARSV
jgi:hypothetical protein